MAKAKANFSCDHQNDKRPTIEPMRSETTESYSCKCEECVYWDANDLQNAIQDRNKAEKKRLRERMEAQKRVRNAPNFMKKYRKNDRWAEIMDEINETEPKIEAIARAEPGQIKEAWGTHRQLYPQWSPFMGSNI
ncbi:hypothetical protein JMJ35_000222 [Cladonia borealis]|uniref:Uncharacterized protein n=1 Tax=Cladonia borealis TaxID=184061 RepID=A0AA39R8W7_9LECA|nr:hypothetical protein JMJ35_000222 [Cladonia borealis]